MGSYLSIHNNTSDSYSVRVGVDEAALQVLAIMGVVVGVMAAIFTAVALPLLSVGTVATGAVVVQGMSAAHLVAITSAAAAIKGIGIANTVGGLATAISVLIAQALQDQNYVVIEPGEKHKFGRYTLSLWRQGTCIRARPDPNNEQQVLVDVVYMRPIFSGATNNSTLVHNIQYWIDRWGHEKETVIQIAADTYSRSSIDAACERFKDVDWLKLVEETRIKAKHELLHKRCLPPQEHYA